jgi:conjugal transfer mating pair stabilization protein TraG
MADTYTVYAYWNIQQLAQLFDAVAALTGSGDYKTLIASAATLGFLMWIWGAATGKVDNPIEFFKWFIILIVLHGILLVPKVDVSLIDRTGTQASTVRSNVPLGLAAMASMSSTFGDYLTRMFETVFAQPDDLQFSKTGLMFGSTLITKTNQVVPTTAAFRNDITNYMSTCVYYDISAGRLSADNIKNSTNLWATLGTNPSNTLLIPLEGKSTPITCAEAYADLNHRWTLEINNAATQYGRYLNPSAINAAAAGVLYKAQINSAYGTLANISNDATQMLQQAMTINSMKTSQMIAAQKLDSASSAMVNYAETQAAQSTNLNYLAMARMAEKAGPVVRNFIELIAYAVFPLLLVLIMMTPEKGGTILKGYAMTLIWVQIIPALYAVLNFVMNTVSIQNFSGISLASKPEGATAMITLNNIGQMTEQGLSDLALAGYLTLSLPAIAWALVKMGEVGGAALFSSMMSPAQSSVGGAAGSVATGNLSQGQVSANNHSHDTMNANKYDVAPMANSGYTTIGDASGTHTHGNNGLSTHQLRQSSLGLDSSAGVKLANSSSTQASYFKEAGIQESESASISRTAAMMHALQLTSSYGTHKGTERGATHSHGSRSNQALELAAQEAQAINTSRGLRKDDSYGYAMMASAMRGKESQLGIRLPGGGSGNNQPSATDGKGIAKLAKDVLTAAGRMSPVNASAGVVQRNETSQQDNYAASNHLTEDANRAQNFVQSHNIRTDKGTFDEFTQSDAYRSGKQYNKTSADNLDSSLSKANTHQQNAERHLAESQRLERQAQVLQENWAQGSVSLETGLASRLAAKGQLNAFNELIHHNPQAALTMAMPHLQDMIPSMPAPTPVQTDMADVAGYNPEHKIQQLYADGGNKTADKTGETETKNNQELIQKGFEDPNKGGTTIQDKITPKAKIKEREINEETGVASDNAKETFDKEKDKLREKTNSELEAMHDGQNRATGE